jgi:glycolate oxidase
MISQSLVKEFQRLLGKEQVFLEETDRATYSYDAAVLEPVMPAIVLRPGTSEELGQMVRLCHENSLPLTVRGAGTNLSGGSIPGRGGAVVLTTALNQILEINEADLYAVVQPGVITAKLAAAVEAKGLFYPPDPGSMAVSTLGGNVAENAGGLRGLKYGVTRDYIMGLTFFVATGESVKTGSRTVKCVSGYNLAALLVGSEGTLGVISEITLKLIPLPAAPLATPATATCIPPSSPTAATGKSGPGSRPPWTPSSKRPWNWAGRSPANTASVRPKPASWKKSSERAP